MKLTEKQAQMLLRILGDSLQIKQDQSEAVFLHCRENRVALFKAIMDQMDSEIKKEVDDGKGSLTFPLLP
jgi:hypothetical protein